MQKHEETREWNMGEGEGTKEHKSTNCRDVGLHGGILWYTGAWVRPCETARKAVHKLKLEDALNNNPKGPCRYMVNSLKGVCRDYIGDYYRGY